MPRTSVTLDRFDEVLGGATNDELVELNYRLIEELGDRAGTITVLALDSGDRDLVNEAATYVAVVDEMFPFMPKNKRVSEMSYYIDTCAGQLRAAIEERANGEEHSRWRSFRVGKSPAAKRMEAIEEALAQKKEEKLLASVEISRDTVLDAFRAASAETDLPVQARDVALALCPDATETDVPGRQKVIARVGAEIRRLASEGIVVKASEADELGRKTCRWELAELQGGG